MVKIKESDMYEPLKQWFLSNDYDVYSEVEANAHRADIVCKKEHTITVVEMKTSINLELIEQVYNWRYKANYIYAAVPMSTKNLSFGRKLLKEAGIGLILMDIDTHGSQPYCSRICLEFLAHLFRKTTTPWSEILLPEFRYNTGGSNKKHLIMSKYKIMMEHVRGELARHPQGMSIDELTENVCTYYANPKSSLYNALTKYEKEWCEKFIDVNNKVSFRLTERGRNNSTIYLGKVIHEAQSVNLHYS
jgi:hypothetical protein